MRNTLEITIVLLLILFSIAIGGAINYDSEVNKSINEDDITVINNTEKSTSNKTEVHIVGTVHYETDEVNRLDLYSYIDNISPSIILFESDSKTVARILKKRDYFFQFLNLFKNRREIEKSVVLKYIETNPNCSVLPYEWELRNKYHHKHRLRSRQKKMFNSIIELNNENLLSEDQSSDLRRFLALTTELNKIGHYGTLDYINSPITDSIVEQRQFHTYTKVPEMVSDCKELSKYLDFAQIHMGYWDTRNMAMVENILKQIKLNPNKVIVVLNGFYHRYYLLNELKKYEAEYDFCIK